MDVLHPSQQGDATMFPAVLHADELDAYRRDGFLMLRQFFSVQEIDLLRSAARRDRRLEDRAVLRADAAGGASKLAVWNQPGDGVYGMFARCEPMAGLAAQLLDDEPYHYHSKMIMKEPHVGGAWEWHQDYGYWYENGLLYPNVCSVMIAVDAATRANGCLQVLRGSHLMGRLNHQLSGDQTGADLERVAAAAARLELVYCELAPGDVVAFHGNTLHRSDANRSELPRWGMICCYNARGNEPYKASRHPGYSPLQVVPRSAIVAAGGKDVAMDDDGTEWLDPQRARTADQLAQAEAEARPASP